MGPFSPFKGPKTGRFESRLQSRLRGRLLTDSEFTFQALGTLFSPMTHYDCANSIGLAPSQNTNRSRTRAQVRSVIKGRFSPYAGPKLGSY